MLPRLWGSGRFSDCDARTFEYIKSLGVTHVWYTGVLRHSTLQNERGCTPSHPQIVKGQAGSPYAVTDYFDVDPWLATNPNKRMEEFSDLISRTHKAGLKVVMDYIPNHVGREYGQFSPGPIINGRDAHGHPVFGAEDDASVHWKPENDFFYYPGQALEIQGKIDFIEFPAKATGNNYSPNPSQDDWCDTVKLNYCDFHTPTWDKMLEAVRFWASKGVDAFRCDMVELVPVSFMKWLIGCIKVEYPDVEFIAEVYQKDSYKTYVNDVGFDYLYDKSGLYDILRDISQNSCSSVREITWNWQFLGEIQDHMLNFLENHDEHRLASEEFLGNPNMAFPMLAVSLFFNRASFMLYFGQEIGEKGEIGGRTSIFDISKGSSLERLWTFVHEKDDCLSEEEKQLLERYRNALLLASGDRAISEGETYDLQYCNLSSRGFNNDLHFAFLRSIKERTYLFFCNFAKEDADADVLIPKGVCGLDTSRTVKVTVPALDFRYISINF